MGSGRTSLEGVRSTLVVRVSPTENCHKAFMVKTTGQYGTGARIQELVKFPPKFCLGFPENCFESL